MPKTVVNNRIAKYIRLNYKTMCGAEIARHFNIEKGCVNRYMSKAGMRTPKKVIIAARVKNMIGRTSITIEQDKVIKKLYLTTPLKRLAAIINKSDCCLRVRLKQLGLVIPKHIIEQRKKESQIKPGNIPQNKGKKMSKALYKKCSPTMFKKGQLPKNTKYDGCIAVRREVMRSGEVRSYQWVRISRANWKMRHVVKWEAKHGPTPPGHIIVFKNKNTMDLRLSNLECITLAENMRRNTIHNLPPEIKKSVIAITTLKRKINKHEKQII